ncbi:MAG TPA: hypothetical protein VFG69_03765 [Nannocystaceae bacterium]|nr:hypothetical protein [Nannocystaceae bacterium]
MRRTVALAVALCAVPLPVLAAPAGGAKAEAPARALEPGELRFHLEVEGLRRNTPALFRLVDYDREGVLVCQEPCGVPVSTSDRFQVRGTGEHVMLGSKPFSVDPNATDVTATVRTARRKMYGAGLALAMIGPVAAVSGALLLGLGAAEGGPEHDREVIAGAACLSAGVAMLIIGIPMIIAGRNRVKLRTGAPR